MPSQFWQLATTVLFNTNTGLHALAGSGEFGPEAAEIAHTLARFLPQIYGDGAATLHTVKGDGSSPAPTSGLGTISDQIAAIGDDDAIALAVWHFDTSNAINGTAEANLLEAGFAGYMTLSACLLRIITAPSFLMQTSGSLVASPFNFSDLTDCSEGNQLPDETAFAMCQRLHPEITWTETPTSTFAFVGNDGTNDPAATYYWSPPPPSLEQIRNLFRYTPASGPPDRFACTDVARILSMLPVQW